ncbi:MAG: tetratricopeptide repeat protein [Gemmatimonadaceae bacterium]|nr:tetratricopeptide repeat protein [Gemmatimonadaceae bacterium]
MIPRFALPLAARFAAMLAGVCITLAVFAPPLAAQTVEYRSPAGVEYRSRPDTGPVARAQSALARDPRNVDLIIALGVAQSGALQFREAVETFTRGLAIVPNNAMLYRWRGHRYLSLREFDKSLADLTRGLAIDSTNYGILFHLGIIRFIRGEYDAAADLFRRAQPVAPNPGELAGSTDWRWMSLARAGRMVEGNAMLDQHPDSLPVDPNYGYARRLALYRGTIQPSALIRESDDDTNVATLAYGLGNWYLVHGDTASARAMFQRSVASGGWAAFGFILSEVELARMRR